MDPEDDPQTQEDFLDFELEIGAGSGRMYPVAVVHSAAGEARGIMQFPFDDLTLENQLLTLQNSLLSSADGRRHMLLPEGQKVQEFGRTLFNTLFTGEVGNLYAISQREADQQSKGLRIKLRILSPEMAALPWEFLYDPGHDEYVCLSRKTPLIRYIEMPEPPQPLSVALPLRILGMIATPTNLPPLDVKREQLRMEKALEPLQRRGLVQLTWLSGQTWRDVQQAMRGGPWHIFHFIGHGSFDPLRDEGQIAFVDEQGQADLLQATQVGRLLADHFPLRVVVLNTCEGAKGGRHDIFSSTAASLVRRGIPAIVAMQYTITDDAAVEFTRTFYEALADSMPIDAAVSEARKAISLSAKDTLEWGVPVLFMRSPDGVLFTVRQGPTPAQPSPPAIPTYKAPLTKLSSPLPEEDALELEPRSASGRGNAAYTVTLHNGGNTLAQYELSGEDDEQKLAYRFGQNPVALEPAREARIPLVVSTSRRLIGREQRLSFQVHALPAGDTNPLTAQGEFVNKVLIPAWLLTVALFVVAASVALAIIFWPWPPNQLVTPPQSSPRDGTVFVPQPSITIKWSPVKGAASYTVEFATPQRTSDTCGSSLNKQIHGIKETSYTFSVTSNQTCWRVWAVDANGYDGKQSGWWTFFLLVAPEQISPANGTNFGLMRSITIKWSPVKGGTSYTVEFATPQGTSATCDSSLHTQYRGIKETSYTFEAPSGQTCWRVWVVDAIGNGGIKSGWWTFKAYHLIVPTQSPILPPP